MGGAEGTRTPDPHTASVVRYQLRHSPKLPGQVINPAAADLIDRGHWLRSNLKAPAPPNAYCSGLRQ